MAERFYRRLDSIHINCENPRAYFIPFRSCEDPSDKRENSSLFTTLNGEWSFRYFDNVEDLDLESGSFCSGIDCPDRIDVPSCWQLYRDRGYDVPNYINQDYPYPVDPPHLPDVIPCGFYRRDFSIKLNEGKKYYVNFEGVSSCFYLWINGCFAGYSQVSHCTSEFDVTEKLHSGENRIEVLVVKHCTGSYMEDQDFFRLSGIFRDVYVLERDSCHIEDVFIRCNVSDDLSCAKLGAELTLTGEAEVKGVLNAPDGTLISGKREGAGIYFDIASPLLWNTEKPVLYTLTLCCGSEVISFPVAVRKIEIKNRTLLLNGRKIKLRGINRHDSHPETGYTVSEEHMLEDLYLLKRANVNTIRTSHYPNDPRFPGMCDRLGFMLIDEADLETHGMGYNYGDWYWDYWAYITNAPEWRESCVDRMRRLFERDKNHGCVIMWSLGNESGCGDNHRHMAAYVHSRLPGAVVHYENAHLEYQERLGKDFTDISDVESRMYAPLDYLEKYLKDPGSKKPFFYCEYVAAWSTGDIPLHWDGFEDFDNYCGGCVWELTDHAVNVGTPENPKYRYGGDFGDYPNDYVYCVDGLVYPDRRPRPGYYDMKITYQPFAVSYSSGRITIKNKNYFESLSELKFIWKLEKDGETVLSGEITDTDIAPRSEKCYYLFTGRKPTGFTALSVIAVRKTDTVWAERGFETGHCQFILSNGAISIPKGNRKELSYREDRRNYYISCGNTDIVFDRNTGKIISVKNKTELLKEPVGFNIFKSCHPSDGTQNDWKRARFDHAFQKTYSTEITDFSAEKLVIRTCISFAAAAMPPAVKAVADYTFYADGRINVTVSADVTERAPVLPRFGLNVVMPEQFENIEYVGYGPVESYCDRYRSQLLSKYSTTVTGNFEHYIVPVESGGHYRTKTASVTDCDGNGFLFADTSSEGFQFNAKHYTDKALTETRHDDELEAVPETIVTLDYKMHAGCASFPELEPQRRFDDKHFEFSYDIKILGGND